MTDTASSTGSDTGDVTARAAESYAELVGGLRAEFRSGRTRPVEWRRAQLEGLVRMLTDAEAELSAAMAEDLGKPAIEAYATDIGFTRTEVTHLLKRFEGWMKPRRVPVPITSQPGKGRVVPEPLGVALVIAPWNYPVQLLVSPLAAALAAGNAVVCKPSELAPATSAVLARLLPRYLDDRAVVVVEGGVPETTALLQQRFDHVFFTGSTRVGRVVMEAAAKHLTPVTLELGGKSPTIVAADADLEVAARRIAWGKFLNAGQTCIAPDHVLADRSIRDRLVDLIAAAIVEFYGPDPHRSADFARIVTTSHLARLESLLADHGGRVAVGGVVDADDRYLAPTLVVDPDPGSRLMEEEIFGPVLPVLAVDSVDAAVEFVLDRPKPLALYVFSGSAETVDDVVDRTSSGGVCVNHVVMHIMPNEMPFGGVGPSGMGAYHGKTGFDAFSHLKAVLQKPTRPDPKILYPPYTRVKEKIIRTAM
jgi:aldehyde dehydrogenase (NAD+)